VRADETGTQPAGPQTDPFSSCTCLISLFCFVPPATVAEKIGHATGFFWADKDKVFLVSNWHVFSGRNPSTDQPVHSRGALPCTINIEYFKDDLTWQHLFGMPLYSGDGPRWIEHSRFRRTVDIALLDVTWWIVNARNDRGDVVRPKCINEMPQVHDMLTQVGMDVFVLGYPVIKTGLFPVWKRASVATEFQINAGDRPCFLIDTATREGMSGSPVVQRSLYNYQTREKQVGIFGNADKFLGIYSGRHIGKVEEAQLGIVWRPSLIDEIIAEPAPGSA
jgi:hypothetical protein